MKNSVILCLFLLTGLCVYADDIHTHDDMFYQCLKTCTNYQWKLEEKSDNGSWYNRYEEKEIKKSDNGKCLVRFAVHASDEKLKANAADVDVAEIPVNKLKKINKKNCSKYFSKYNVME